MHEQLLQTYNDLFENLNVLPDLIADCNDQLTAAKENRSSLQKRLATLEATIVANAGGWKALGKNETERKYGLVQILDKNTEYRIVQQSLDRTEQEITELTNELDKLTRQYGAICYQARLHAALLNYLGNAGAPVTAVKANGNTMVNPRDAESIGL